MNIKTSSAHQHTIRLRKWLLIFLVLISISSLHAEYADPGLPLKKQYEGSHGVYRQTVKKFDGYSFICEMSRVESGIAGSRAIPDWPATGVRLELRARAIDIVNETLRSAGFVVITRNRTVLKAFKPLGKYDKETGKWDGDVFQIWNTAGSQIELSSELGGKSGFAKFDLKTGDGYFYASKLSGAPNYSLHNCRSIKKNDLPEYEWIFD